MDLHNIIFDLGNVVINVDEEAVQKITSGPEAEDLKRLHYHLFEKGYYFDMETGKVSPAEFRDEIRKFMGPATDEQIDKNWNTIIGDIPPERIILLEKLNRKYRTFILSNTNVIHYDYYTDYTRQQFGVELEDLFEYGYFSHKIGLRKPDPEIFRHVISQSKLKPEESLFIDDKEENITAARKLNIRGYLLNEGVDIVDLFDKELRFKAF